MNLPIIPQDKANHYVYGSVIAIFAGAAAEQIGLSVLLVILCSIGAAALFGAAKELIDLYKNRKAQAAGAPKVHGVEIADFLVTVAGGLSVNLLLLLYKGVLQ